MFRSDLYPTGRHHCSKCRCWRPLLDFGRYRRARLNGTRLQSWCQACQRSTRRKGEKPRDPARCQRGHRWTPENTRVYADGRRECRTCANWNRANYRKTENYRRANRELKRRPEYREAERFRAEARRREAGIPPRNFPRPAPQGRDERVLLPAEPFVGWLRENGADANRARMARTMGTDESHVRRLLTGEQKLVHIDTVDRAVGPAALNELYPVDELVAA